MLVSCNTWSTCSLSEETINTSLMPQSSCTNHCYVCSAGTWAQQERRHDAGWESARGWRTLCSTSFRPHSAAVRLTARSEALLFLFFFFLYMHNVLSNCSHQVHSVCSAVQAGSISLPSNAIIKCRQMLNHITRIRLNSGSRIYYRGAHMNVQRLEEQF